MEDNKFRSRRFILALAAMGGRSAAQLVVSRVNAGRVAVNGSAAH